MAGEELRPEEVETIREDAAEADEQARGPLAWLRDLVRAWGPAILAVLLIRAFVFEPFRIPSSSMMPTLLIGDHVLVTRYSYGLWLPFVHKEIVDLGDPQRGDIIVFRYPMDERVNYIKRVVGIPGDRLSVRNNQVVLNGEPQPREYTGQYEWLDDLCTPNSGRHYVQDIGGLQHDVITREGLGGKFANTSEIVVPEGHVFVMGDNRDNSEDSRSWGFVRYDQIKGKARFVWMSWNRCSGGPRTDRFFHDLYASPAAR